MLATADIILSASESLVVSLCPILSVHYCLQASCLGNLFWGNLGRGKKIDFLAVLLREIKRSSKEEGRKGIWVRKVGGRVVISVYGLNLQSN